ncbi:uncharacterized protein HMPREF1120_04823 [Exophiala dermatitidis NIH/UT8656]|uniref:Uncharacterized protein n=1 Tax=Exophiala dermatitidis (strain ATCC 34100 / CBS 525.76 / NIH/UT8656) TaxID=858893 RepID=H6BYP3_EXODN|nr:uncharacterized protein HMPREF1120_04823 [Exophiala dermatitidis NIH/UT8656]EHY56756.1 hypothetical protein HMPREF1120_04823 [Exophiala dermatitidis NIH/UT8656]
MAMLTAAENWRFWAMGASRPGYSTPANSTEITLSSKNRPSLRLGSCTEFTATNPDGAEFTVTDSNHGRRTHDDRRPRVDFLLQDRCPRLNTLGSCAYCDPNTSTNSSKVKAASRTLVDVAEPATPLMRPG